MILFVMLLTIAWGAWTFAPWVPMRSSDISRALTLMGDIKGTKFFELGSGDGRMTLAAAAAGADATGLEIAIPLFVIAWFRAALSGSPARFRYANLFHADLASADIVFFFGMPKIIADRLRIKLEKELKPGAIVVSYAFPVEGWEPDIADKPDKDSLPIYRYVKKQ
jgi:SAM-dependent methyltransferase